MARPPRRPAGALLPLVLLLVCAAVRAQAPIKPACSHAVYCNLTVLQEVADNHLVQDSKTFVDMELRHSPATVMRAFEALFVAGERPSRDGLETWLDTYFHRAGHDLEEWTPEDFHANPPLLEAITDTRMRQWALELNAIWPTLGRKVSADVAANPDHHSLLPARHPFIVPGGRFREFYYWDTYWMVTGLLGCNMHSTAKGMIENLLDQVDTYGHVLNGGRVYYEERSQPPMLTQMVRTYAHIMKDTAFVKRALPQLEAEYDFWMSSRSILLNTDGTVYTGARRSPDDVRQLLAEHKIYRLNQYRAHSNVARPEGFKEDRKLVMRQLDVSPFTASSLGTKLYRDIATAAESGWDFSSRWCSTENGDLTKLRTSDLIAVDLNAILYKNELTLAAFYRELAAEEGVSAAERARCEEKASEYTTNADVRASGMMHFMWVDKVGLWLDYDLARQSYVSGRSRFYASSLVPLWAGLARHDGRTKVDRADIEEKVLVALRRLHLFQNDGGMPVSLVEKTHLQWDYPNQWAPLTLLAIDGLESIADPEGLARSRAVASAFLSSAYNGWVADHVMYEKYDARTVAGSTGTGGEYEPQVGFGWTNGVVIELLLRLCTKGACVPINGQVDKDADDDDFPWAVIAVGVVGALLAVCVAALIAFLILRRRRSGGGGGHHHAVSMELEERVGPVDQHEPPENGESLLEDDSYL